MTIIERNCSKSDFKNVKNITNLRIWDLIFFYWNKTCEFYRSEIFLRIWDFILLLCENSQISIIFSLLKIKKKILKKSQIFLKIQNLFEFLSNNQQRLGMLTIQVNSASSFASSRYPFIMWLVQKTANEFLLIIFKLRNF